MFIFERERQSTSWGAAEREGDTESETGSRLWAVSTEPSVGLELMNHKIMTWAEVGCLTNWATQVPHMWLISKCRLFDGVQAQDIWIFFRSSFKYTGCWNGKFSPARLLKYNTSKAFSYFSWGSIDPLASIQHSSGNWQEDKLLGCHCFAIVYTQYR